MNYSVKTNLVDYFNNHSNMMVSDWLETQKDIISTNNLLENDFKDFAESIFAGIKSLYLWELLWSNTRAWMNFIPDTSYEKWINNFLDIVADKNINVNVLSFIFFALQKAILNNIKERWEMSSQMDIVVEFLDTIYINILKIFNIKFSSLLNEYKNAIDSSSIVCKINLENKITYINDKFVNISWFGKEDLIGKDYIEFIMNSNKNLNIENIGKEINENWIWTGELTLKNIENKDYWLLVSIIPILNDKNTTSEFISIWMDITKQKILEIEVQKHIENEMKDKEKVIKELQEISKSKDEFLNIASHELRTPMTVIKWYVSMILSGDAGDIPDNIEFFLAEILKSSERLINLINDMLDIAKLESGKVEFTKDFFEINDVFNEVNKQFTDILTHKKQTLEINIADSIYIKNDRHKFKQIFINLISNAIKFTPEWWKITVNAIKNENNLSVDIVDTGVGIPEHYLDKIFEKFVQVKSSLVRDTGWTGLWLSIVKKYLENMEGEISVKSEEWLWSTFTVVINISEKED